MPQQKPADGQLRILVVEDNDLLRNLFSEAYRHAHIVHTASNAEEGWRLYLDKNPHIVFLDIGLPDANGHDLAHKIKESRPATYIVMATASDCPEDAKEAKQNNVDGFIVKPFDKQKINSYIDRYLATRRES